MTFETTYQEQYAAVYRFCCRMTGSAEEGRDLTQETFMRLYTAVQRNEIPDQPVAWLFRVAGNLCISNLRQNRRRAALLDQNQERLQPSSDPPDGYDNDETLRRIRQALERLSPRDRLLINLYQEQRSYAEIAEIIGVRKSSVGTLLSRALSQLRTPSITGVKS
jgi:RNA polymerase sigma factor (sigma-70 family)